MHNYKYLHPLISFISKNLYFTYIQLIMYIIIIMKYIHHLMNESKLLIFIYNSD